MRDRQIVAGELIEGDRYTQGEQRASNFQAEPPPVLSRAGEERCALADLRLPDSVRCPAVSHQMIPGIAAPPEWRQTSKLRSGLIEGKSVTRLTDGLGLWCVRSADATFLS